MSVQIRSVLSAVRVSLCLVVVFLFLCCLLYPGVLFGLSEAVRPLTQAESTLSTEKGEMSLQAGQPFQELNHFWGRADRNLTCIRHNGKLVLYSLPENNALSDPEYIREKEELKKKIAAVSFQPDQEVPEELCTASGSGMDPDISVQCARYQVPRVARANSLDEKEVERLIGECSSSGMVNTVLINQKLDALKS